MRNTNAALMAVLSVVLCGCGSGTMMGGPEGGDMSVIGGPDGFMNPDGSMGCVNTTTADNCGACGNACPGLSLTTCEVTCADPQSRRCGFTCRGENYDVDKDPANGCEQYHSGPGHSMATATDRGHKSCTDGSSTDEITASLFSDSRVHTNPAVDDFSGSIGSAPDYIKVEADGGACVNDYSVTFTTRGGGATDCYRCTFITDKKTDSVTVSGAGSKTMSGGASSYSGGSVIYFKVEKLCTLPVQEAVVYKISYHL